MKGNLPSLKQEALLAYIDGFIKENNYAPSYREVMRALDYKSVSTVAKHIDGLIERGWLVKRDNSARSVEVTYREGRHTVAPDSPALASPAYEKWLADLIETRIRSEPGSRPVELAAVLEWLQLDDLAKKYGPRSPEEP